MKDSQIVVGAITIGQSPRVDVIPEMKPLLGERVDVVEVGVLDDLNREEIRDLEKHVRGAVLVTRLRDGTEVKIGDDDIISRAEACIRELEAKTSVIMFICTGTFPRFDSRAFILYPESVLYQLAKGVLGKGRLGVLTPGEEQIAYQQERWRKIFPEVVVMHASPYAQEGDQVKEAARRLKKDQVDLVVMDCIGYTLNMKAWVREIMGKPVLLARSALARVAAELLT